MKYSLLSKITYDRIIFRTVNNLLLTLNESLNQSLNEKKTKNRQVKNKKVS